MAIIPPASLLERKHQEKASRQEVGKLPMANGQWPMERVPLNKVILIK